MHVDTTNFGEGLAGCRDLADRMHELARALPGAAPSSWRSLMDAP